MATYNTVLERVCNVEVSYEVVDGAVHINTVHEVEDNDRIDITGKLTIEEREELIAEITEDAI